MLYDDKILIEQPNSNILSQVASTSFFAKGGESGSYYIEIFVLQMFCYLKNIPFYVFPDVLQHY